MAQRYYDVFISYARGDRLEWVQALAETLHQRGFKVFLDAWEIGAGDVLVHELDRGILESRHGVLVLTRSYFERPFVRAEYAAILQRTIEGRQRVIPVLVDDMEVPPLLAAHVWVDFRGADGPEYDRKVEELARTLGGKKAKDGTKRSREGVERPESRYRPEGVLPRTLRIERKKVTLLAGDDEEGGHEPKALDHALEERIYELGRERHRRFAAEGVSQKRGGAEAVATEPSLHEACLTAGAALTRTFLDGPAGKALREVVTRAEKLNASLELGLEIPEEDLRTLPWEALRIPEADGAPGEPLALHPRIHLYRAAASDGPTPALAIPGPLRILVAIGSPETGGGELLDYEKELARILDAVEPARKVGKAHIQILHRGTVQAIRDALEAERYHVLHLSCHAAPGVLILETHEGEKDEVTADRFWKEALPPDRGVPLIVLSGCATALDVRRAKTEIDGEEGEQALPGLATELLDHGVHTAIAMQAPVSDAYATDLAERLYRALATHAEPAPLDALTRARQEAELRRRQLDPKDPGYQLAEWATPALYLQGIPQLLYDPAAPFQEIQKVPEARFAPGVVARKVGEFVGRRVEQRLILKTFRGDRHSGVLIRGIGGVGKSTLAAEVLARLVSDGRLVVSVVGETTPETILEEIGKELLGRSPSSSGPEVHPLRQVAAALRRRDAEWSERLDLLQRIILPESPLILLLDNFEDNLANPEVPGIVHTVRDQTLADFLTRWLENPGQSHLLITSRFPFPLTRKAHRHLEENHLGPLSFAETRKLFWRLPALEALSPQDRLRAYRAVGGHPKALEYLDALLRGGDARFIDVEIRLEKALERKGVNSPRDWIREHVEGDLDKALAETVTLASGDALLEDLLGLLDRTPLARQLLVGASVFLSPVGRTSLVWLIGEYDPNPVNPRWKELMAQAQRERQILWAREGRKIRGAPSLSPEQQEILWEGFERTYAAPIDIISDFDQLVDLLTSLGLISVTTSSSGELYQVHPWTARVVLEKADPDEIIEAHRRAGCAWLWNIRNRPPEIETHPEEWLEMTRHFRQAGDTIAATVFAEVACHSLHVLGMQKEEEQLARQTLEWVMAESFEALKFQLRLAQLLRLRGALSEAMDTYNLSAELAERQADDIGRAAAYRGLGEVATEFGAYDSAAKWFQNSILACEGRNLLHESAKTYSALGVLHLKRGEFFATMRCQTRALELFEELGDDSGAAGAAIELGSSALHYSDTSEARRWYKRALSHLGESLSPGRAAQVLHQLGVIAEHEGAFDEALTHLRKSLEIDESRGNLLGIAISYHHLARVALKQGRLDDAEAWFRREKDLSEVLENSEGVGSADLGFGQVAFERKDFDDAVACFNRALSTFEKIGDKDRTADTLMVMGISLEEAGRLATGVRKVVDGLEIHLASDSPKVVLSLLTLRDWQDHYGLESFNNLLRRAVGKKRAEKLLVLVEEARLLKGMVDSLDLDDFNL